MMLAHVPWLREDVNSLTSVARRGRAGLVSEVINLEWKNLQRSSAGPESVQVETPSKCWDQNGLNDLPNWRLIQLPRRSLPSQKPQV